MAVLTGRFIVAVFAALLVAFLVSGGFINFGFDPRCPQGLVPPAAVEPAASAGASLESQTNALNSKEVKRPAAVAPSHQDIVTRAARENLFRGAGQDRWAYETIFKHNPRYESGLAVEFGAQNGLWGANSFFFQYGLHWRTILAEAIPAEQDHVVQNRPGAVVLGAAFCPKRGKIEMLSPQSGWAGFLNSYDKDRSESFKEKPPVINATCLRIDEVLDLFGVRHINYLSVDTEGSELMILETFPFDRITADLVGVESLKGTEARSQLRAGIIAHMESKGYKVAHTHPIDGGADTEDLMFTPIKPWPEDKETLESNAKFDDMHRICKVLQRCLDSDAPKWNGDAGLVTEQKSA